MGYSPSYIEERRKEEKQRWIQKGVDKAKEINFNKHVEDGLIGGFTKFEVTSMIPKRLTKGVVYGDDPMETQLHWFLSGAFRDFLDDWSMSVETLDKSTNEITVSVSLRPKSKGKKKKTKALAFPSLPNMPAMPRIPDIGGTEEAMSRFRFSMEKFHQELESRGVEMEKWLEELSSYVEHKDDPEFQAKWKLRESGQTMSNSRPARVEKKLGWLLDGIGKELRRFKAKLGLADPPVSKSAKKTHPVEMKD